MAKPSARISAAIEKLERLKVDSSSGTWSNTNGYLVSTEARPESEYQDAHEVTLDLTGGGDEMGGWLIVHADADLIVTLHRTIEAQLTILRYAQPQVRHLPAGVTMYASCDEPGAVEAAMDLADAILGEQP